jgi:hypothetical protein
MLEGLLEAFFGWFTEGFIQAIAPKRKPSAKTIKPKRRLPKQQQPTNDLFSQLPG